MAYNNFFINKLKNELYTYSNADGLFSLEFHNYFVNLNILQKPNAYYKQDFVLHKPMIRSIIYSPIFINSKNGFTFIGST